MGTEESVWTKANLQKLLAAIKTNIPENERKSIYTKSMKTIDWKKVSFPPHSPEACRDKWITILQKMRKIRTLDELVVEAEDTISDPKLNSKIHPELPKKPSPPNALYYEDNWTRLHNEHPEFSNAQLLKLATSRFKSLSNKQRERYIKKFKLANEEYNRRLLEFGKQYGKNPSGKTKKVLKRKRNSGRDATGEDEDGLPPKPPFNGYNLFCKEQVISKDDAANSSNVKIWAQRWKALDLKQRHSYSVRCEELRRQFVKDLQAYLKRFDEEEQQEIITRYGITHKDLRNSERPRLRLPNEPKKPSQSENSAFFKRQMELLKDKIPNSKDRFTEVRRMWKKLSAKERHFYKGKVNKDMKKYYEELQEWFEALPEKEQNIYEASHPRCLDPDVCRHCEDDDRGKQRVDQASDSEDEDIEDSSDDEDEDDDVTLIPDTSEDDGETSGSAFDMD
ncbi:upstream-binding factor 1-like protein 1 [Mugil cephalus]|uniref:upstream-binding factor 1-like protein 1 n=1 Tax=Mugil cephalus TaxID=48193 RepID=UPI001FB79859|nr:upstream-binding factor 1-like protein 1 [Mugil cephalus]